MSCTYFEGWLGLLQTNYNLWTNGKSQVLIRTNGKSTIQVLINRNVNCNIATKSWTKLSMTTGDYKPKPLFGLENERDSTAQEIIS